MRSIESTSRDHPLALENVSLFVECGEAVGLLAEQGAGRSSLVRAATGESRVDTGTVYVRGQPALISRSTAFLADKTLRDNMARVLQVAGLRAGGLRSALREIAAYCSAEDVLDETVDKARPATVDLVRLACLLRLNRSLLIIDDPKFRMARMGHPGQELIQYYLGGGGSLLMASDDPKALVKHCSRILWLDGGRIVKDGPTRAVARDFQNLLQAEEDGDGKRAGQLRRRVAASYRQLRILPNESGRRKAPPRGN